MMTNGYEEMSALRLECAGLMLGDVAVPPFQLRAGQGVCLHMPPSCWWWEKLLPLLKSKVAHPRLRTFGAMAYLERPMPRRRWWGRLYNPSAGDWLRAERGLTSTEAEAVLNVVGEPADMGIGLIGWKERTLLALEAILLRSPDLLVFDTCGNDWETAYRIFDRLAPRTPPFALLYLKTRLEREDPCLPGAACLELVRTPSCAAITE